MTPFKHRVCVVFNIYIYIIYYTITATVTITINPSCFNLKLKTTVILLARIIIIVDDSNTWLCLVDGVSAFRGGSKVKKKKNQGALIP